MNAQNYTQKSLEAIQAAQKLTIENQNQQIEQLHLLAALAFLFFTSSPPALPLFVDPTNGTRGIPPKTL